MSQWISINDSLPEFDKDVLISVRGKQPFVQVGRLDSVTDSASGKKCNWVDNSERDYLPAYDVLYWMPLPDPATIPEK